MKRIRAAAAEVGLGLALFYLFFLIPSVSGLFSPDFVLMLRQVLVMGTGISIAVNPHKLVEYGQEFAPKIKSIISILFNNNNTKDEK